MTKDVLVSITGLQFDGQIEGSDETPIEMITRGDYYKRNGKHYLLFEESVDGIEEMTRNTMKFSEHNMELMRKGATNVHMIFDEKTKTVSRYGTPFGEILIGIDTDSVTYTESEEEIKLSVDYALEVNYEYMAECKIHVDIRSLSD